MNAFHVTRSCRNIVNESVGRSVIDFHETMWLFKTVSKYPKPFALQTCPQQKDIEKGGRLLFQQYVDKV